MPSKILLVSVNQCKHPYPVFPLGLSHLTASLQAAGHTVEWHDLNCASRPFVETLQATTPNVVGLSLRNIDDVLIRKREVYFDRLTMLCAEIRRHSNATIVLGGSGFSIFPRELLEQSGADYGIQGEGESALVSLMRALEAKATVEPIPGLVFRRAGRIECNTPRFESRIVERGPVNRPPALAQFYLERSSMLNVQTQRGCCFDCCYCTYPLIEGRSFRARDPEAVAEECAQLQQQGVRYVSMVDSIFNSTREHVASVCEALLRRGVSLQWGCFLRPAGLDEELIQLMARAGLRHIEYGSDSFCDPVLEAYGKRFDFDDILHSSELARQAKVEYCHFLVCGGPGETRATLEVTYQNSLRLTDAVILAVVGMRVYPGTPLHALALGEGVVSADADLLRPHYYLSPGLSEGEMFAQIEEYSRCSPNWIVGDPPPSYFRLVERLRRQGVVGPLWGYFSWMQRLRQAAFPKAASDQPS